MTVQDLSFLRTEGPAELLDRSLEEYVALLRTAGELHPREIEAVDYALRHSVVRLLTRAAGSDELATAYEALRRMVPVARERELAAWIPRWRAFADLLDARRAVLANRDPEAALRLAHAGTILALVEGEYGLTQVAIGKHLGLKPANLSRILGVLEAHELIERRVVGREKKVFQGRLARPKVVPTEAAPVAEPVLVPECEVEPGNVYLWKPRKAA